MTIDVRELVKAGVHFGHRTSRWNPKMRPYILKKRNLIHIIDVRETVRGLVTGRLLTETIAARGEYVLFVGTKRQASAIVQHEAERCGMPCVAERWPGGLLTNYMTIRKRLNRLLELEDFEKTGQINLYSKKMISSLRREYRKIKRNLGGVRSMDRLPGLVVIVDPRREHLATREAAKLAIPSIAWTDTDGDPDMVDVVVPANDDSIGAIQIFVRIMADAVLAGRGKAEIGPSQAAAKQEEEAAEIVQEAEEPEAQQEAESEAKEQTELAEAPDQSASEAGSAQQ